MYIDAGDGPDRIEGGPTSEYIDGGSGDDEMWGGGDNDLLDGGPGDDSLENSGVADVAGPRDYSGADELRGGDGTDFVTYSSGPARELTITLDDQANDPDGDNIRSDVERVEGSPGDDRIIGNDGPNRLEGGNGTDVMSGGGGNDVVLGGLGIDQVNGDAGDDEVNGEAHGDVVEGGPGIDRLYGDTRCESAGCGGPDHIKAIDGEVDSVVCRDDNDTVEADQADTVAADCENVQRAAGGGGTTGGGTTGGGTAGGDTAAPAITGRLVGRYRIGTALRRGLTIGYSCNEACGIVGQVTVSGRDARGLKLAKTVVVARGKSVLGGAGKGKVKLRFTKKAKKKLRSRKKVKLRVTLVAVDPAGNASAVRRTVTLKR